MFVYLNLKSYHFFLLISCGTSYPNGRKGETEAKCQTGWIQYFVMKRVMLYHKYQSAIFIGDVALNIICRFFPHSAQRSLH